MAIGLTGPFFNETNSLEKARKWAKTIASDLNKTVSIWKRENNSKLFKFIEAVRSENG